MVKKTKQKKKKQISTFKEASKIIEQQELDEQRKFADFNENDKTIDNDFDIELSSNEPIRELFSSKNVRFKTQLTEEQRGAVSILYHAYEQCKQRGINFSGLKRVLDEYIDFGVSVDRKSRQEYVESHKSQMMSEMMSQKMQQNKTDLDNMKV